MAWYHQWTANLLNCFPWLYEKLTLSMAGDVPVTVPEAPWTSADSDPFESDLMLVTSGGVHRTDQSPFDMTDSRGDPTLRWIPRDQTEFEITHDYYDHSDAEKDINCLYPLPLARKLSRAGLIGSLVSRHLSCMGHIEDPLLPELTFNQLPAMWDELADRPDLVLLSPG